MLEATPTILALDFDGVLCDGLIEYFQTAWHAYCQLWLPTKDIPPEGLAEQFYRLRPVVETGWEMPVLVRSLLAGIPENDILHNWTAIAQEQITIAQLTPAQLSAKVDTIRDEWIATDVNHWLAQHQFYPGVVDRLRQMLASSVEVYIVTTKEGRFVKQLLQQHDLEFAVDRIFGKEVKQPKTQTLRMLLKQFDHDSPGSIWFVEDRLKTLQNVQSQPDLATVSLFLADWGYNTEQERAIAQQSSNIHLVSLQQFAGSFSDWQG